MGGGGRREGNPCLVAPRFRLTWGHIRVPAGIGHAGTFSKFFVVCARVSREHASVKPLRRCIFNFLRNLMRLLAACPRARRWFDSDPPVQVIGALSKAPCRSQACAFEACNISY